MGERGPGAECRALGGKQEKKKKKRSVPGNWFYPTRRRKGGGIFVWDAVVHGFFPHLVFGTVVDMGQPCVPQLSFGLCHVQISTGQPGWQRKVQIDK